MKEVPIHHLIAHGYEVCVDAAHGASLTSLKWRKPDGEWFEILHPCPPAEVARTGGSFVMAPFTNRLDNGRFETPDGPVQVPLNRPEQQMAIHGFSRDRAWRVVEAGNESITLVDEFADDTIAFRYRLTQTISVDADGVTLSLNLINTGDRSLPYGMGFHPWFRKESNTWLTAVAKTGFARDKRGFTTEARPASLGPAFVDGLDVSRMPFFDGHFAGWESRQASIEWRGRNVKLDLSSTGALTNLHIYVPDNLPILCVEPVSHVPDVHNRRNLAPYGDLTWLAPGEAIEGAMTLKVALL